MTEMGGTSKRLKDDGVQLSVAWAELKPPPWCSELSQMCSDMPLWQEGWITRTMQGRIKRWVSHKLWTRIASLFPSSRGDFWDIVTSPGWITGLLSSTLKRPSKCNFISRSWSKKCPQLCGWWCLNCPTAGENRQVTKSIRDRRH